MDEPQDRPQDQKGPPAGGELPIRTCVQDPFAGLPPELRPKPQRKVGDLRQVTCPGCGMGYWTNRQTDLCLECEKKGLKRKGTNADPDG
ncbi:MAG: hypothetical protein AB1449_10745 [Chloroflexota bacterium]